MEPPPRNTGSEEIGPQFAVPRGTAYVATLLLEALLTAVIKLLQPHFPIGNYPIPYVLLIMAVAYMFGEGPAVLAFFVGFVAFVYFFVYPIHFFWPPAASSEGWARVTAFLLGTLVVGFATTFMRRARRRIERLAAEADQSRHLAEHGRNELETILSSMTEAVVVVDADRRVVYANDAAELLIKTRREIGQPLETWAHFANIRELDDSPIHMDDHPLVRALRGETVSDKLLLIDGENGPRTVVSANAAPIRETSGEITGAVVIVHNITHQMRLREELSRQRAILDTFIENIPIGLGFHDRDMRYVFANHTLAQMARKTMDEVLGKTVWEVLPQPLADQVAARVREAFETGQRLFWKDAVVMLDMERYFDIDYLPVRTPDGEVIGVGVVVVETTEDVKARRELQRNYEHAHHIAEAFQASVLSIIPRKIEGFLFDSIYRAAMEEARVGGDFYDVFEMRDGKVGIVLGDVSGKGLKAAVQVAMIKYPIRSLAYQMDSPAAVLQHVNSALVREMDDDSFATVFFGVLDSAGSTLTYANGGHSPAILWRSANMQVEVLSPTGLVVGMEDSAEYAERTIHLHPGDEILLGTDGLIEVRCGSRFLELEDVLAIYSDLKKAGAASAEAIVEHIVQRCGGGLQDDVAVLSVTVDKTTA